MRAGVHSGTCPERRLYGRVVVDLCRGNNGKRYCALSVLATSALQSSAQAFAFRGLEFIPESQGPYMIGLSVCTGRRLNEMSRIDAMMRSKRILVSCIGIQTGQVFVVSLV